MYTHYNNNNIELPRTDGARMQHNLEESADNAENKNKSCHGLCFYGSILLLQYLFITYYNIILSRATLMMCSAVSGKVAGNLFSCCTKRFFNICT